MTVRTTVDGEVDADAGDVLPVLDDVASYPCWWPATRLVESGDRVRIQVTPVPLVHIVLEKDDAWRRAVRLRYVGGPFRGTGTWVVRHGDSTGHSRVSYAVDLTPVGSIVRAVAATSLFRRKHEYDVCRIIARLSARVRESGGQ